MAKQALGLGSVANDGTGDDLRAGGTKINANFDEIYTALGDGSTLAVTETVQDIVGGMVTGNTETLISVTYQDVDGTLDFVVDQASLSITESQISDLGSYLTTVALNDVSDVTLTTPAQGDILYRNASGWVNLGPGTSGQFLQTQGAASNPQWATPAGSGNVSNTGTPVDNQLAVWTAATTVEGTTGLTYTGSALTVNGGILLDERADHGATPAAGKGEVWVSNDATQKLYFTDDAGTDKEVAFVTGGADLSAYTGILGLNSGTAVDVNTKALLEARISDVTAFQVEPTEGAFANGDKTKLDGIEALADVTDAANVETAIEAITLTPVAGATGDEVLIVDATDGGLKAVLWENLPGAGGGMTNFTVTGDSGTPETIADGNTLDIAGGTGIATAVGVTDTVTINVTGVLEDLNTLGAPASDGQFIVATGAGAFAYESGATARTSMGAAALAANVFTGTQDFNGQQVEGMLNKVVTSVTGALTAADHSGNVLVTSGNVTVPTTAGFNAVIVAGGAHTVTFNATTSAAMAAGDVMTVVVESATVIHAVLTAAADKVSFT